MTEGRKARLERELELLQTAKWGWSDIMDYYQCASEKANNIRKVVAKNGGQAPYDPHKVLSRKVIEVIDSSTVEDEIWKRRIELEGVSPQDKPDELKGGQPGEEEVVHSGDPAQ